LQIEVEMDQLRDEIEGEDRPDDGDRTWTGRF
jgi:hypothetical protein